MKNLQKFEKKNFQLNFEDSKILSTRTFFEKLFPIFCEKNSKNSFYEISQVKLINEKNCHSEGICLKFKEGQKA